MMTSYDALMTLYSLRKYAIQVCFDWHTSFEMHEDKCGYLATNLCGKKQDWSRKKLKTAIFDDHKNVKKCDATFAAVIYD